MRRRRSLCSPFCWYRYPRRRSRVCWQFAFAEKRRLRREAEERRRATKSQSGVCRVSLLLLVVLFLKDGGGGHGVVVIEAEQANALRGAAGFANFVGMHAYDFAVVRDDHDVGLFGDLQGGDDRAV